MVLARHQNKQYCRMCINQKTSEAGKRTWAIRLWTTVKIRKLLPDIEENI